MNRSCSLHQSYCAGRGAFLTLFLKRMSVAGWSMLAADAPEPRRARAYEEVSYGTRSPAETLGLAVDHSRKSVSNRWRFRAS